MSWLGNIATRFKIGGTTGKSGGVAKERLSIILAHQRGDELMQKIDLEGLQHEVLELVKASYKLLISECIIFGCVTL